MVLPYKNEYGDELDYRFFYFPTFILILLVTLAMSILPYIYIRIHIIKIFGKIKINCN